MSFVINKDKLVPTYQRVLEDENGDAVDLTASSSVTLELRRVGTSSTTVLNAQFQDRANGLVKYEWQAGDTAQSGDFEANWVVDGMSYPNGSFELVVVYEDDPLLSTTLVFCTSPQARALLGKDIDIAELALAQTVLSMFTGIQPSAVADSDWDLLDDQDQIGLRQATAFQAAWLEGQPDYFTRLSVSQESVDGESRVYNDGALELAPMAVWALSNTRFSAGTHRTLDASPARSRYGRSYGWLDMVDNNAGWEPLDEVNYDL